MNFFYVFCIGTAFGSFANVYFYRFCQGLSIVYPSSFCPQCRAPIRWHDNIPLISYLMLRGKCRQCRASISWTYPLTEFLCGLLFLIVYSMVAVESWLIISAFLSLYFILFLIGGTDIVTFFENEMEYGIIPDSLVALIAAGGLAFSFINPFLANSFWAGLIGGGAGFLSMMSIRWAGEKFFHKEAMGLGDVKLVSAIGLWFGWKGVFSTLLCASLGGSLICLALLALKKLRRDSAVPFGPFLALGSLSGLFF